MAKHIITINTESIQKTTQHAGCSECQTSCQSVQNVLHSRQSGLHKIRLNIEGDTLYRKVKGILFCMEELCLNKSI